MKYNTNISPKVGGVYISSDFARFEIKALPLVENAQWVEYSNVKTKQEYTCLIDAFLARFSAVV